MGEALAKLEFMVVQDIFFSETCKYADVVLPASSVAGEGWDVCEYGAADSEVYQALEPLGESKPDWEIIQLIAKKHGRRGGMGVCASVGGDGGGCAADADCLRA